jgi:hypothetical protein
MNTNFNDAYMNIILEENLISSLTNSFSKFEKFLNSENLPIDRQKILKCIDIARNLSIDDALNFLNEFKKIDGIIKEDADIESFEKNGEKATAFMRFIKKFEPVLSFLIPFYDGLITDEELNALPGAFKSIASGTWGRSLIENGKIVSKTAKLGRRGSKAFAKISRLSKKGFKPGGRAVIRLTKRQLTKLASKAIFKPLSSILSKLAVKLGIAAAGGVATGATAATVGGIPIAVILAIAEVIYVIWLILDILSIVNDILRLVAQVHLEDQNVELELEKEDESVNKIIDLNPEQILATA